MQKYEELLNVDVIKLGPGNQRRVEQIQPNFCFFFVIFAPVQTAEPEQQGVLASHTVLFGEERQQAAHLSVVQAQAGGASSLLPGHSGLTVGAGGGGSETMEAEGLYRVQRERGDREILHSCSMKVREMDFGSFPGRIQRILIRSLKSGWRTFLMFGGFRATIETKSKV